MYNCIGDIMKAMCIGNVVYDTLYVMNSFIEENNKYRVKSVVKSVGGPACTAAALLSMWGVFTYFSGVIGNDYVGKKIINELHDIKVNTKYLEVNKNISTKESVVIVNKSSSTRTILSQDIFVNLSKRINVKVDLILIDGQEYEKSIELINNNPSAIKIIDAGRCNDKVISLCKMVDYVICSSSFIEEYTGIKLDLDDYSILESIFDKAKDFKNLIITLEENGALYKDDKVRIVRTINVNAVDTTGAGDIFHGAFSYFIMHGFDIKECITLSNIAASVSTTKIGGKNSIPSLDDVMSIYKCLI